MRRRDFITLFVVVVLALLANGVFEVWFHYQEHKSALVRIQREQAAAARIEQFIKEIESQLGWTTQLSWSASTLEQHRFDVQRLLRQVPAITKLTFLDDSGNERFKLDRHAAEHPVIEKWDWSETPAFTEAMAHKVYYGPVYFRSESEPYMMLSLAGTRRDVAVTVADVNLKFIWDVVSQIKVGERGDAYVVDREGRLIAHPDISLVLRNTDMSQLAQVRAARQAADAPADAVQDARDIAGREVLTAYAPIAPLGWLVFVELPVAEAYAPLYAQIERSFGLLLVVMLAFFGIAWFSRRSRRWASRKMSGPSEVIE